MYKVESYKDGMALIAGDSSVPALRATYQVASLEEAQKIVVGFNASVLYERLAAMRYSREEGGVDIGGTRLRTDEVSMRKLTSAFVSLGNGLVPDVDWKGMDTWGRITFKEIQPFAKAAAAHSRACFRGEREVQEAIAAATTIEATEAIDVGRLFDKAYAEAFAEVMSPSETTTQATT